MNFAPPEILVQLNQLLLAQQVVMKNRTLVNSLFNGDAPYTPDEQRDENIYTNINFLEGTRIASNATNQLNNSCFKGSRFFSVHIDKGPQRLRSAYSQIVSNAIAKEMKRDRAYRSARESAHAQVVLHGAGPMAWRDRRTCLPGTAGIEDVLIPNGTLCNFENLDRFGIYQEMTWPQLERAALGPVVDQGWNLPYVKSVLGNLYKTGYVPTYYGNRWMFPEKLQEDYKEGAARAFSSSLPKALVWNFFFRNEDTGKWNRRVLLDYANAANMGFTDRDAQQMERDPQLLYAKDNYADEWSEIIHWYIGNCSNVAPYRYHSIRSIGYLLFGVVALQNKLRCRMMDHTFTQLLTWFRNVSDDNREKLGLIDLQNFGVMPDGVSMVTAGERHVADYNLIELSINQNRQLMSESSTGFLPDMEQQSGREMTATETMVRQNTAVTLTSAVTNQLADQSLFEYREIVRRFFMRGNPDPAAKRFRESIQRQGVPLDVLDIEACEIMPEQGMGGGNKAAELMGTQALMQEAFPLVDPQAQRLILRKRISAITDNPEEAMLLVPEQVDQGNVDVQQAQLAFAVLMGGSPFVDREGVNHVVMATVLMGLANNALQQSQALVQQPTGVTMAAEKVAGVANVLAHVQQEVQKVAQAETFKQAAKQLDKQWQMLSGELQQVAKAVQAAEQQLMQAQQANGGLDPKTAAKIQEIQATAATQRDIAKRAADQKLEQRQAQWAVTTQQKVASAQADTHMKHAQVLADLHANELTTRQELLHNAMAAQQEQQQQAMEGATSDAS